MAKLRQKKRNNVAAKKKAAQPPPKREPSCDSYSSYSYDSESSGSDDGSESNSPSGTSDENQKEYKKGGYHPVKLFELYNDKYRVLGKLGAGAFSTVWLCANMKSAEMELVAMKVCKSAKSVTEQSLDEMKLLSELNSPYVMSLKDHFWHQGPNGQHKCLIFNLMGENLLALLRFHEERGLPLDMVKKICTDTLKGVAHIKERNIIHTDIKLENVLIRRHDLKELYEEARVAIARFEERKKVFDERKKTQTANLTKNQKKRLRKKAKNAGGPSLLDDCDDDELGLPSLPKALSRQKSRFDTLTLDNIDSMLTDFGNGCWLDKHFTEEIQTRQYRSPEVLLGQEYDCSTDIWSCACMFFELLTGEFLFSPKTSKNWSRDEDHIALMIELLGTTPPVDWALKGSYAENFLTKDAKPKRIKTLKFWSLEDVMIEKYGMDEVAAKDFCDFLLPMLEWLPEKRISAEDALKSPWLNITEADHTIGNPTHSSSKKKDDHSSESSYESYSYDDDDRNDDEEEDSQEDSVEDENSEEEEEEAEAEEVDSDEDLSDEDAAQNKNNGGTGDGKVTEEETDTTNVPASAEKDGKCEDGSCASSAKEEAVVVQAASGHSSETRESPTEWDATQTANRKAERTTAMTETILKRHSQTSHASRKSGKGSTTTETVQAKA